MWGHHGGPGPVPNQYPGGPGPVPNQYPGGPVPPFGNQFQGYPGNYPGAVPYAQAPQVHQFGVAMNLDVSLIVKLIFLVYLLGRGSPERLGLLTAVAICYYLYQTGVARFVRLGGPQQQPAAPPGDQGAAQNQGQNNEAAAPAQPNLVNSLIYHRQGVVGEVLRFVVPLFCSIFPSWHPTPDMRHPPNEPQPQQENRRENEQH